MKCNDAIRKNIVNSRIQICHAGRDDICRIAAFLNDCWKVTYRKIISDDYLDTMSIEERKERLLKRFDEGVSDFLMMFDGNNLFGAAVFGKSFTEGYEEDGEITSIYLHENYIGKGYGHTLYKEIEQALTAKGYSNFVLDVLTNNIRAIKFYQSHGYLKVADRHVRLGKTDYPMIIMRKKNVSDGINMSE